jgi:hypothetical protein
VLAALMIDHGAAALVRRFGPRAMVVPVALLALVGGDLLRQMIYLHPQEYVYFNRLIGGVGGAHNQYDTDYYGNTFKEAAEGMADFAWRTEPDKYLDTMYYYSGCVSASTANRYLPPNFRGHKTRPGTSKHADFYLGYVRGHCDRKYPNAEIVFAVERGGANLNVVKDIRPLESEKAAREAKTAELRKRAKDSRAGADATDTDTKKKKPTRGREVEPDLEMGPALPPALAAERAAAEKLGNLGMMGPALPPAMAAERAAKAAEKLGETGGAAYGPALPPDLAAERSSQQ